MRQILDTLNLIMDGSSIGYRKYLKSMKLHNVKERKARESKFSLFVLYSRKFTETFSHLIFSNHTKNFNMYVHYN